MKFSSDDNVKSVELSEIIVVVCLTVVVFGVEKEVEDDDTDAAANADDGNATDPEGPGNDTGRFTKKKSFIKFLIICKLDFNTYFRDQISDLKNRNINNIRFLSIKLKI